MGGKAGRRMVTFIQAYDAAVQQYAEAWELLTPSQMADAIYREMRRLDAEEIAAERAAADYSGVRWHDRLRVAVARRVGD